MTPIEKVLERLQKAKQIKEHEWMACCPAHADKDPSLHVTEVEGKVLMHCMSQDCSFNAIVAALDLKMTDLFSESEQFAARTLAAKARGKKLDVWKFVSTYDYQDENGNLLYQVCRYDPKDFRQRHPDPDKPGEWIWNMTGVRKVPFRLPDLIAGISVGKAIWIVEGEKDALALAAIGLTATCNVGGAGKFLPEYTQYFRGANVVIIGDKDPAGRKHAQEVAAILARDAHGNHL